MKQSALIARRAMALNKIMDAASKLPSEKPLDLSGLPKGNAEHVQCFQLERIADFLGSIPTRKPPARKKAVKRGS
ncbi:MAG: hypothetical protein GY938_12775 [Ketobacter sp.]|nr:hypothetical protein [Ketobacter sp.]